MKTYKIIYEQVRSSVLFYCFIILFGCSPDEQSLSIPTIEVDVTSNAKLKMSDYFDNFRILRLPSDIIIGEIDKIRYENNRIYISDGRALFIFSDDGELLSYFDKIGNGPGEYSGITDFIIDDGSVIILDRKQQRLTTYDHSGRSMTTRNLEYNTQAISPSINNSFFFYCSIDQSHKLRRIKTGEKDSLFLPIDKIQSNYLFIFAQYNFYQYQKAIYFFQPVNDTVYVSIDGSNVDPFFCVDFKGKNIPSSFLKKPYRDIKDFFDQLHEKPYGYGIYSFAVYDRFFMFSNFYQKEKKLTVFDRKDEKSKTFSSVEDDVYFKGLTIPVSQFTYHANKCIFVPIDASTVVKWKNVYPMSEPFNEIINTTEDEENPLLLIFDFKQ